MGVASSAKSTSREYKSLLTLAEGASVAKRGSRFVGATANPMRMVLSGADSVHPQAKEMKNMKNQIIVTIPQEMVW